MFDIMICLLDFMYPGSHFLFIFLQLCFDLIDIVFVIVTFA